MATIRELRNEAKRRGYRWADVQAAYEAIKVEEQERREYLNEVRRDAWGIVVGCRTPSAQFWRHGFQRRYGDKVAENDYTLVPKYDLIAQEIGWNYPEYQGDDGADRLFDFLFTPYNRMPTSVEMYERALERVAAMDGDADIPF